MLAEVRTVVPTSLVSRRPRRRRLPKQRVLLPLRGWRHRPGRHAAPSHLVLVGSPRPHGIELAVEEPTRVAELRCDAPDVPAETHQWPDPFSDGRTLTLLGLLADTEYTCELLGPVGEPLAPSITVRTPALAIEAPWSVVEHVPERFSGAYTLFNLGNGATTGEDHLLILVDPQGRVRWVHPIDGDFPDCDVQLLEDGTVLFGGGQGITPTIISLDEETVWQAPTHDESGRYHHHAEKLEDGTVLTMRHAAEEPPLGQGAPGQTWTGFRIERIAPDGRIPWSWASQRAVDEGWLPVPLVGVSDPWHANSVSVDPDGITYVNLRNASMMLAIDPTGQVLWRLGAGGDFQLLDSEGSPLGDEHWFHGAHAPEHHGDRILFHDNGWSRGVSPAYSQVLELVLDVDARTATRTWTWSEPGWYEPAFGDADELDDGGVLIAMGHCGSCGESSVSQIVEVDRTSGEVDWRLRFDSSDYGIYRAERIDGCAIFHHTSYCPDPLARRAAPSQR